MHLLLVEMKSSSDRGNVGGGAAAASKQVVNLVEERERGMLPFCVSMCLVRGWWGDKRGHSLVRVTGVDRLVSRHLAFLCPPLNPAHTQVLKRAKLISFISSPLLLFVFVSNFVTWSGGSTSLVYQTFAFWKVSVFRMLEKDGFYRPAWRAQHIFSKILLTEIFLDLTVNKSCSLGPCHHGTARPLPAERGSACSVEGRCEYIE
jgi:hypothetical protein